jgi:hypothetical protein
VYFLHVLLLGSYGGRPTIPVVLSLAREREGSRAFCNREVQSEIELKHQEEEEKEEEQE